MKNKKILCIVSNDFIKKYICELIKDELNIKFLTPQDNILLEMENFKPYGVLLQYNLRDSNDKDIFNLIKTESINTEVPILLYSFTTKTLEEIDGNNVILFPTSLNNLIVKLQKVINNKKYILVVDDSKLIHKQLRELLTENNYEVIEAYNGKEALEKLEDIEPDLITSDIEMPVMNGYEFCAKVKKNPQTEKIPFIILSSLSSGIDIDKGFEVGTNDYLTKPIDKNELLSRITGFLGNASESKLREKILVVDDSKMIRNMVVQGFKQQGFKVYSAVNGQDGLEKAKEIKPDLITSDYDMPIMDGWELCQALRKDDDLAKIPTILLTSRDDKTNRAKITGAGVKAYLTKPFTIDKLIVIVERILAEVKVEREREILKFYISDAAYKKAVSAKGNNPDNLMTAKETYATVMFTDIASFTTACEKMSPNELISLLNDYFDVMCEVLNNNDALIDKFIGDAIMALFNGQQEDAAYKSVKAGIEMLKALSKFNEGRETPLNMRIGINSGKLFMGDIGSKYSRKDFTVIGDAVNLASRLEGSGKAYGINFVISEETVNNAGNSFAFRKLDKIRVKGKFEPVLIYQVIDYKTDENVKLIKDFEKGLDAYFNMSWKSAMKIFENILKKGYDPPSKVFYDRCKFFIKNPPEKDWNGVFVMTTK